MVANSAGVVSNQHRRKYKESISAHAQGRSKKFSRYDCLSLQVYTLVCFTYETIERVNAGIPQPNVVNHGQSRV